MLNAMRGDSTRSSIEVDIEELRRPVLIALCWIAAAAAWLWTMISSATWYGPPPLRTTVPAAVMIATSAICLLANRAPLHWRGSLFFLGMSYALILGHRMYAPSLAWLYYQSLVVGIAGLLAGPRTSLVLALLLTAASVSGLRGGALACSMTEMAAPLGLIWAIAITSWISSRNLYTALGWALESQSRAWETAHEVRRRRGELRRTLGSLRITYAILERTTRELEAARREAEEARRIKSRFVANISHELRTPLNIIVGFAEMLCTSPETYGDFSWPPALREDLLTIWRNGEHLLNMIDDVLDLAQIEAARLPVVPEPTDLTQLIQSALATAGALLRDSGLELRVSLPNTLPTLDLDRTRIRQVLLNLINNAVRFTPQGYIEVGAYLSEQEAIVYVRDSGEGIPEDRLEAIFREFEQADTSIRRRHQGVGLGLAVSRHLIRLHGGRIWAESEVGKGSTFSFSLPLPEESGVIRPSLVYRGQSRFRRRGEEKGEVVALCRDPLATRMLQRHLEKLTVLATESLHEAVSLIRERHPQAALITADTPDRLPTAMKEAQSVLDQVAPSDLPVVVCSFPTERRAGATLGVDEFLIKPVMRKDVISAVRRLCENPRRILVVDDEPDMLRLLARTVKQEWQQSQVLTATSGSEAIALLRRRPDVILLDLLMPDVSGMDVLDALRSSQDTASTPVAVITARGPAEDLAAIQKGRLYMLRNNSFTAADLMRCLDSIAASLPPHYVTDPASLRGFREAVPA